MLPSLETALIDLTARSHRLRPAKAARTLGVTRARVQKAIEQLVAEGLAFNAPDPHDGRVNVVCLTTSGQMRALELRRLS